MSVVGYDSVVDLSLMVESERKVLALELVGLLFDSMPEIPRRLLIAFDTADSSGVGGYEFARKPEKGTE